MGLTSSKRSKFSDCGDGGSPYRPPPRALMALRTPDVYEQRRTL